MRGGEGRGGEGKGREGKGGEGKGKGGEGEGRGGEGREGKEGEGRGGEGREGRGGEEREGGGEGRGGGGRGGEGGGGGGGREGKGEGKGGVSCDQNLDRLQLLWSSAIPCLDGQVQLANGLNRFSGRVEKCVNQEWGTVCADGFDAAAAQQACRMAGLNSEGEGPMQVHVALGISQLIAGTAVNGYS